MAKQEGKNTQTLMIDCENADPKKLSFTKIDNSNVRSAGQGISYANYDYMPNTSKNFVFRTNPIKFTQYGIPQKNEKTEKFIKSDQDREYFRIPYDPSQPNCVTLFKMLEAIDARVEECKDLIFGDQSSKYRYSRIVKEPNEVDEDVNPKAASKPKTEKYKFCKVKLDTQFDDNRKITTSVFLMEDGKPVIQDHVTTVSDVEQYLAWNSSGRFVIMMNKLWAEKQSKKKGELREFGISLKCLQMVITERSQKGMSIKEVFKSAYAFDSESTQSAPTQSTTQVKKLEEVVEEEEEEQEEEQEEEEQE